MLCNLRFLKSTSSPGIIHKNLFKYTILDELKYWNIRLDEQSLKGKLLLSKAYRVESNATSIPYSTDINKT